MRRSIPAQLFYNELLEGVDLGSLDEDLNKNDVIAPCCYESYADVLMDLRSCWKRLTRLRHSTDAKLGLH